jgi:hypothetical protein
LQGVEVANLTSLMASAGVENDILLASMETQETTTAEIANNILRGANAMRSLVDAAKEGDLSLSKILAGLSAIPGPQQPFVAAGSVLSGILGFQRGTRFAPGGLSLVGEGGPELVNLPRGSQVFPNAESQRIVNNNNSRSLNINISGGNLNDEFEFRRFINRLNKAVQNGDVFALASDTI